MQTIYPLVNWNNGIIMIGVFALVCIVLVAVMIGFINSERKK
ncbi:hypothetical protein ACFQZJ_04730 [Maribacter chungangensis]|uniref:Uncharacterized protein n=1 Tax=Maribacter chungangensis TaxID=1069117 RepID=A0ABW3B0U2_9FLAO